MYNIENCKSLNDIAKLLFNKANYYNREKVKKYLFENGIDWKEWLYSKHKKVCLNCGKELNNRQNKFCSQSCSATFNNKLRKKDIKYCLNCGKELVKSQKKYCSIKCQHDFQEKEYINNWKNGVVNGLSGEYGLSNYIRNFLIKEKGCKCELCGWKEKNIYTNTIPLEIHHKDGNYLNNSKDNLQVLCPNCHSLTETSKSHNKNGRKGRKNICKNFSNIQTLGRIGTKKKREANIGVKHLF